VPPGTVRVTLPLGGGVLPVLTSAWPVMGSIATAETFAVVVSAVDCWVPFRRQLWAEPVPTTAVHASKAKIVFVVSFIVVPRCTR
jgi:hypothetical protein